MQEALPYSLPDACGYAEAVIAALTTGEPLPECGSAAAAMNVIYQTAEDGLSDTIKPRLESAGADCSRVLVIDESRRELTLCDERLEQAIRETGARLIVLDPLQAYLGSDVDMHRANEVRPVLKHISAIAERTQCAVILVGHMNKAQGLKSGYRGLGSIDFRASARSVLLVGRLKSSDTLRVVARQTKYAPSTLASYRRMLERVYPYIGAIKLNKLRPMALENMMPELRKRTCRGKPVQEKTAQKYLTVVSAVLSDAKRNEIIQKNPARMIDLPATRHREQFIPTVEEAQRLLQALAKEPRHFFVSTLLHSGIDKQTVAELAGKPLCKSAYKYASYWYPAKDRPLPNTIYNAGYDVDRVDLAAGIVYLTKAA